MRIASPETKRSHYEGEVEGLKERYGALQKECDKLNKENEILKQENFRLFSLSTSLKNGNDSKISNKNNWNKILKEVEEEVFSIQSCFGKKLEAQRRIVANSIDNLQNISQRDLDDSWIVELCGRIKELERHTNNALRVDEILLEQVKLMYRKFMIVF